MKNRQAIIIVASVVCLLLLGCDAVATLFHGEKPEEPPVTYTVTFHANGASGTPPPAKTVTSGTVINLPDQGNLTKGSDLFAGWSENQNSGTIHQPLSSITVNQNMDFYARWIDTSTTPQYTVTFDRNGATGGNPPTSQTQYSGLSITIPNQGTLVNGDKTFGGWNTLANGNGTNYPTGTDYTITGTITLYAKWQSANGGSDPVTPEGTTLAEQLAYIRNNAGDGTVFDIVVNNNEYLSPQTVSTMGRNITVNIRSENPSDVKTIQLEGAGHLFSVDTGITLKLQDIVLRGHSTNDRALVAVGNGTLILNSGAKITGNLNIAYSYSESGGGIYVNGGVLELNEGAEISGNRGLRGGGVCVQNRGSVTIRGGLISENTTRSVSGSSGEAGGGGIYISDNSTVSMTGGIISKNTTNNTNYGGGGIYVADNGSSFTKRATPPGSSSSGIIYGGAGDDANTAPSSLGHAIRRDFGTLRNRNTALGGYDEISTGNDVGWE